MVISNTIDVEVPYLVRILRDSVTWRVVRFVIRLLRETKTTVPVPDAIWKRI